MLPRKASSEFSCGPYPKPTQVENTKAIEITVVKELGKMPP
jgi:hypothetical protein